MRTLRSVPLSLPRMWRIASASAEASVNNLIARLMVKTQQMRWSERGPRAGLCGSRPALPHRTGDSIGVELHERPWIVDGNDTLLVPGMCFSIEPMLCVCAEGAVGLEDIVYVTESGGRSFCTPQPRLTPLSGR